jgi:hypothetical protein
MSGYAKFWTALIIGVAFDAITAVQVSLEGGISASEWLTVALVVLGTLGTALGVWAVPNKPTT